MTKERPHILIVDDEQSNLEIVTEFLSDCHYKISTAADGILAWEILRNSPSAFDVILLDRIMPNMDGMQVLQLIKEHPELKHCPVIFQSALTSQNDILEGLESGAFYYLTKPFEKAMLLSVIKTAVRDRLQHKDIFDNLKQTHKTLGLMKLASFEFKTLEEARSLALLISQVCPEPEKIVMGLTELMINAIEHGNLGISYTEKSNLNARGDWETEINRRLKQDEFAHKYAEVSYTQQNDKQTITIIDQGNGFDWRSYLDFDPARVMDNHGRGIAIANKLCFSQIEYQGLGNIVCAII